MAALAVAAPTFREWVEVKCGELAVDADVFVEYITGILADSAAGDLNARCATVVELLRGATEADLSSFAGECAGRWAAAESAAAAAAKRQQDGRREEILRKMERKEAEARQLAENRTKEKEAGAAGVSKEDQRARQKLLNTFGFQARARLACCSMSLCCRPHWSPTLSLSPRPPLPSIHPSRHSRCQVIDTVDEDGNLILKEEDEDDGKRAGVGGGGGAAGDMGGGNSNRDQAAAVVKAKRDAMKVAHEKQVAQIEKAKLAEAKKKAEKAQRASQKVERRRM